MSRQNRTLLLCAWALLFTLLLGWAGLRIQVVHQRNYSFFYDPVNYQLMNAGRALRVEGEGRLAVAAEEWIKNMRCPLRTTPLILFAPSLLSHPTGHLATALPALLIFLSLLGMTMYRRTKSLPYSMAGIALVCAIPGLYHLNFGIAVFWLDLVAALYAAAAFLCLLNSSGARSLRALAGFAALAGAAALSRYIAIFYLAIGCLPILGVYLFRRWQQEKRLRSVVVPLAVIGSVFGLVAGYYLVAHLRSNLSYYTTFQYDKNSGITAAASFLFQSARQYLGVPTLLTLIVTFSLNLAMLYRRKENMEELILTLIAPLTIVVFLIFFLQPTLAMAQVLPYPLLFLLPAFIAPASWSVPGGKWRRLVNMIATGVIVGSVCYGTSNAFASLSQAGKPSELVREQKAFDLALAKELVTQSDIVTWTTLFDEHHVIPTMEAFYDSHRFIAPVLGTFSIHEAYWRGWYPGLNPAEVAEKAYLHISQSADLVVILEDPSRTELLMNNAYSRVVASEVARRVPLDSRWKRVFDLPHSRYGRVVGYRNQDASERKRVHEWMTRYMAWD